jgi:hypothetical protein
VVSLTPALEKVEFDLSVTAETTKGSADDAKLSAGFKISIVSAQAGIGGSSSEKTANTTVQRIKFSIPFMITDAGRWADFQTRTQKKAAEIHVA